MTLFTTPDWRQISPFPTRRLLAKSAWADDLFLAPTLPKGTMAVENHPKFCEYLNERPRMEVGYHGLNHIHTGPRIPVEFQEQDRPKCQRMLRRARQHFDEAQLEHVLGFQPPGWNLPQSLSDALLDTGFEWGRSGARHQDADRRQRAHGHEWAYRCVAHLPHPIRQRVDALHVELSGHERIRARL